MTNPIAARTLEIATAQLRSPAMEGADVVYETTAEFWHTYVSRVFATHGRITPHDVLQMLGMHAMSYTVSKPHQLVASRFVEQAACVAGAAQAAAVDYPTLTKYPSDGVDGSDAASQ